jgi:hypothetical protein
MTKTELVKRIAKIYTELEDLESTIGGVLDDFKRVVRKVEDLPEEPDEIEDE